MVDLNDVMYFDRVKYKDELLRYFDFLNLIGKELNSFSFGIGKEKRVILWYCSECYDSDINICSDGRLFFGKDYVEESFDRDFLDKLDFFMKEGCCGYSE